MKKYQIIYADPPWNYQDKRNTPGKNNPSGAGGASKHYKTTPIEELKKLGVAGVADKNCIIFMWATSPFMKEAIELIEAWGFKYKTIPFVWIKMKNDMSEPRKDGIGNYTPNNAEYVLLGRKGKYWRNSTKVKQIVMTPKTKHSRKPAQVRRAIVELVGDIPRIELFARPRERDMFGDSEYDGWDVWGNEVESDIKL